MITKQEWLDNNLDVSGAIPESQINLSIDTAIVVDLRDAFNNIKFYNLFVLEVEKQPIDVKWTRVLEPYEFEYNGADFRHSGLKKVLSYWSYAHYVKNSKVSSSPFGVVSKTSEYTADLEQAKIHEIVNSYRRKADYLFQDIRFYLTHFVSEFNEQNNIATIDSTKFEIEKIA